MAKTVVVVMNDSGKKLPYHLWVGGKAAELVSLPHSYRDHCMVWI